MSYFRPAKREELLDWLRNLYEGTEDVPDLEHLTDALLDRFEVVGKFNSPV